MDREALRREIREKTEFSYSRSGGPGGQNVNKRDTKVTARLAVDTLVVPDEAGRARIRRKLESRINYEGFIVIQSELTRSQGRNREDALERMEILIVTALRPDPRPRKATRPSRAAKERRLNAKKKRGKVKSMRRGPHSGDD